MVSLMRNLLMVVQHPSLQPQVQGSTHNRVKSQEGKSAPICGWECPLFLAYPSRLWRHDYDSHAATRACRSCGCGAASPAAEFCFSLRAGQLAETGICLTHGGQLQKTAEMGMSTGVEGTWGSLSPCSTWISSIPASWLLQWPWLDVQT